MPYPWARGSQTKRKTPDETTSGDGVIDPSIGPIETLSHVKTIHSSGRDGTPISKFPWFSQLAAPCESLRCIHFNVPESGVSAGSVLKHAQRVMNSIFSKHEPCIFKIGFSHNPAWRWANRIYGYKWAPDRWTDMVVLYVKDEPFSPAMLEAALIDKYIGALANAVVSR